MHIVQFKDFTITNEFVGTRGVSYVAAEYQHEHHHNEVHPRLDYYDPLTKKMKPVRSVVEDDMTRDFPRIIDCGPDETQNAYEGDPDDCKGFFFCDGKFYIHRRCGPGLLFDRLRGACDWPENVDCDDRPLPWNFAEYQGVSAYHHYKPRKT